MNYLQNRRTGFRQGISTLPLHYWNLASHSDLTDSVGDWHFDNSGGLATGSATGPGGKNCVVFADLYDACNTSTAKSPFGLEQSFQIWVYFNSTNPNSFYGSYYYWWADGSTNIIQRSYLISDSYNPYYGHYMNVGTYASDGLTHAYGTYSAGNWYHVVATCNALGNAKLYINGVLTDTGTATSITTTPQRMSLGLPWYLSSAWFRYQFYGSLAMLGQWNVELTAEDVTYLYNGGAGRHYSELL